MPRALVFSPFPLLPANSGSQKRTVSIVRALGQLGFRVSVAWLYWRKADENREVVAGAARALGVENVASYTAHRRDYHVGRWLGRLRRWRGSNPLTTNLAHSPWAAAWLRHVLAEVQPDLVVSNLATWDQLLPAQCPQNVRRVIDGHDLVTENEKASALARAAFPMTPGTSMPAADDPSLSEAFYEQPGLKADPNEFKLYDRYQITLAISRSEAETIRANTCVTRVHWVPMTFDPVPLANNYSGPPLFAMHPHSFNLQGYAYFVRRVLPHVLRQAPDFRLRVIGPGCSFAQPAPQVDLAGFVPEVRPEYVAARFAVIPILGGTGQLVRLVEAMAHGLPVVASRRAARSSPVMHGENGFIADSAEEFAAFTARLWASPELCRSMGQAARDTVAREFSEDVLARRLEFALSASAANQNRTGQPPRHDSFADSCP